MKTNDPTPSPISHEELSFDYLKRTHWFKILYFDSEKEFFAKLKEDGITGIPEGSIAYTDCYPDGQECGRMYLWERTPDILAHEATHMALGVLARHGNKSLEVTTGNAPKLEEDLCELVGLITGHLLQTTTTKLLEEFEAIIGEDEPRPEDLEERVYIVPTRNSLRATQRAALKELKGQLPKKEGE